MRRICYSVAASLDGYIAGPNGEADWITMDPYIDSAITVRHLVGRTQDICERLPQDVLLVVRNVWKNAMYGTLECAIM